jgi:hypothetical protein
MNEVFNSIPFQGDLEHKKVAESILKLYLEIE